MDFTADWSYERLEPHRCERLRDSPSYRDLVRQIVGQVDPTSVSFCLDEGRLEPVTGALRPIFYADVDGDLVDWFFNGVSSYRAQYYLSSENGLAANRLALEELEEELIEAARRADFKTPDPNDPERELSMPETLMRQSLHLRSAKIWGDETQGELSRITAERQSTVAQIIAPRWVAEAENGIEKARKGIKAPRLNTLKFHGAFLKDGEERVLADKLTRSGWTMKNGFCSKTLERAISGTCTLAKDDCVPSPQLGPGYKRTTLVGPQNS